MVYVCVEKERESEREIKHKSPFQQAFSFFFSNLTTAQHFTDPIRRLKEKKKK